MDTESCQHRRARVSDIVGSPMFIDAGGSKYVSIFLQHAGGVEWCSDRGAVHVFLPFVALPAALCQFDLFLLSFSMSNQCVADAGRHGHPAATAFGLAIDEMRSMWLARPLNLRADGDNAGVKMDVLPALCERFTPSSFDRGQEDS